MLNKENIFVTKSFLPSFEDYSSYVKGIFENGCLTNNGPLVQKLELQLKNLLKIDNFCFLTNGTIALQFAIKTILSNSNKNCSKREIITTPFTFIATSSSVLWENCSPIFADILPNSFTIDPVKVEKLINENTVAILATHVFGIPCKVDELELISKNTNIPIIYDAAHAFGVRYKNQSIFNFGDISTVSFHATKIFHTIEGGACICNDKKNDQKIRQYRNFGMSDGEIVDIGINGKQSEFNAAMGLSLIQYLPQIISKRKNITELYLSNLNLYSPLNVIDKELVEYNYAYMPIVFNSESQLLNVFSALKENNIFPRRYFYPSLDSVKRINPFYTNESECEISNDISRRIACIPLYPSLDLNVVESIIEIINENV